MSERVQCSRSFALGRPHAIQYAVNNVRRSNSDRSRRGYTLWEERLLGLPSRRAWFLPKSNRLRRPRAARRSAPPTRCRSGGIGWKVVDQVGGYPPDAWQRTHSCPLPTATSTRSPSRSSSTTSPLIAARRTSSRVRCLRARGRVTSVLHLLYALRPALTRSRAYHHTDLDWLRSALRSPSACCMGHTRPRARSCSLAFTWTTLQHTPLLLDHISSHTVLLRRARRTTTSQPR